jgi:hypothetical protein
MEPVGPILDDLIRVKFDRPDFNMTWRVSMTDVPAMVFGIIQPGNLTRFASSARSSAPSPSIRKISRKSLRSHLLVA